MLRSVHDIFRNVGPSHRVRRPDSRPRERPVTNWRRTTPIAWLALVVLLPLSGCQCQDQVSDYGWVFEEPDGSVDDPPDVLLPETGGLDIGPETDTDTGIVRDTSDTLDVRDVEDTGDTEEWEQEDVLPVVCEDARNDRTSMVIDDRGTIWLGYHRYTGQNCQNSTLVVAHRPVGGQWSEERIQAHQGIFAVETIEPDRPIVAYPDAPQGTFEAARRQGPGQWKTHQFNVGSHRVTNRDGFDVTHDGRRFYVTFAADNAPQVRLYEYDTQAQNAGWESLDSLEARDPQAALERGLRADSDDSVYLVHRNREEGDNNRGVYGVARYDKDEDDWPNRAYLGARNEDATVHSFVITDDFQLCMSSALRDRLLVTCGSMFNLQMDRKHFSGETISTRFPSSIIEGHDGTLYVAYNPADNSKLKVAKRSPDKEWSVRTVFEGSSYGVSTAIDKTGDLVMSFYTCDEASDTCSLKVIRENPDEL